MKLRKAASPVPQLDEESAALTTHSFEVQTITPLYGGGVVARTLDLRMPVRASSIRGQLRYWWRVIHQSGDQNAANPFHTEKLVFGGMGGTGGATASAFDIWVTELDVPEPVSPSGPGYAMFPLRDQSDAEVLPEGLAFRLNFRIRDAGGLAATEIWERHLLLALRWWASFGGLGARTRRGMGAVKVDGLAPVSEDEAKQHGCELVERTGRPNAGAAWQEAIKKLSDFRQKPGFARNPPSTDPRTPGRSRWPEPDSIREIVGRHLDQPHLPAQNGKPERQAKNHRPDHPATGAFPRAYFGLPIITQFKHEPPENMPDHRKRTRDPEKTTLVPIYDDKPRDRLASPLILKPMWNGKDYRPIALLLPHNHIDRMGLELRNNKYPGNPNLPHTLGVGKWWSPAAQTAMSSGTKDNPLKGKSGDVLGEFLNHFKGNS